MWKCSKCDVKFEKESQLRKHQTDKSRCVKCCSQNIKKLDDGSYFCEGCGYYG